MLGAVMGDIIGSKYEFDPIKTKDFPLFSPDCFFTDDTVMTAAVASALIKTQGGENFRDCLIDEMKAFGHLYPDAGYGERFYFWLFGDSAEPYMSFGNGSAMRVSPCGLFAESLAEAERLAEISAEVTHNHPEGIKGAKAVAAAIYMAKTGSSKEEIKSYIEKNYYELNKTPDEIRPGYSFDVTCQGSVPESIECFLCSSSYEDTVRTAVSLGGDSDTMGAIAGSIAYAFYGEDPKLEEQAMPYLTDDLIEVISEFSSL